MNDKLKRYSICRKNTKAHVESVKIHMKLAYGECGADLLPPIYNMDIDELSDEDIRLLDNLNEMFFKGEVAGKKL